MALPANHTKYHTRNAMHHLSYTASPPHLYQDDSLEARGDKFPKCLTASQALRRAVPGPASCRKVSSSTAWPPLRLLHQHTSTSELQARPASTLQELQTLIGPAVRTQHCFVCLRVCCRGPPSSSNRCSQRSHALTCCSTPQDQLVCRPRSAAVPCASWPQRTPPIPPLSSQQWRAALERTCTPQQ